MTADTCTASIVAARFAPFNFTEIAGFPHVVPAIDTWGDYLPWFREKDEDNPALHVVKFHQYMDQLNIHHEDVLMKLFMYSLDGYARQWYRNIPSSSISSLKYFHDVYYSYCKRIYLAESLFEHCCEQYPLYI